MTARLEKLITANEVCEKLSCSRPLLDALRNAGGFPNSIKIGTSKLRWREGEIDRWIVSTQRQQAKGKTA